MKRLGVIVTETVVYHFSPEVPDDFDESDGAALAQLWVEEENVAGYVIGVTERDCVCEDVTR